MDLQQAVREVHTCPLDDIMGLLPSIVEGQPLTLLGLATRVGETGVMPPEEVTDACRPLVAALFQLPPKDLVSALTETLMQTKVDDALEWLLQIGLIKEFYPELEACKDLQQEAGRRHKDVWEHTKLVVKQAVRRPALRWGALLHDIGKVPTRTFTDNGVHFHGHAEVGARMFDGLNRRMPLENTMRRKVRFLIKYHLRSAQYEDSWTDSAVRRFAKDMDEHLVDLLDLSRADITSKRPGRRRQLLFQISALSDRIDALLAEDAKKPNLPKGLGNAMMARFDLPASRFLGDLMKALNARIESGELEAQQEFDYYLDWLEQSGLLAAKPH
ncbi:MAG: HD domain-containing protein [Myxococcales bacterium]|nr:HD domain-containing protein [Myxococcales bacterium]